MIKQNQWQAFIITKHMQQQARTHTGERERGELATLYSKKRYYKLYSTK